MNFYEELKTMTDEEIDKYLSYEIYNLENRSKINNGDNNVLGYDVSYNPLDCHLLDNEDNNEFMLQFKCFYSGYVPKDMKFVYGVSVDSNGIFTNDGMYYVVDDDSYIYEFCKYIRNIEINTEGDLFKSILTFLKNYFGIFENRSREEMSQMILKNDKLYHDPIKEHKLSDFKRRGNAMCSEYAIVANNILNVFGIDSYIAMGQVKSDKGIQGHVFNFISYTDDDYNRVNLLIDFSKYVNIYDFKFNKIGRSPFTCEIENFNSEFIDDFVNKEKHITARDYSIMVIGSSPINLLYESTREYFVGQEFIVNIMSSERQKYKSK